MSTTTPEEPEDWHKGVYSSHSQPEEQVLSASDIPSVTPIGITQPPAFLQPVLGELILGLEVANIPLAEKNHLGVRGDIYGWGIKTTRDIEGRTQFDCLHDPGPNGKCPFCMKEIGEDKELFACRTFDSMPVLPRWQGKVGKVVDIKFFYRYHKSCWDPHFLAVLEESIKSLRA